MSNTVTAAQTADIEDETLFITFSDTTCFCGCQQPTNGKSNFRQGHDMKLVSLLLLAVRKGLSVQITDGGGLASTMSPERAALRFGGAFPEKLANRAAKAKKEPKAKAPKAEAAPAPEVKADENTPRSARCKVGRWIYDGTIEDGEFYYTNKRDEVVYVEAGKFTEVTGS